MKVLEGIPGPPDDPRLLAVIDGSASQAEQEAVADLLSRSEAWQRRFDELAAAHAPTRELIQALRLHPQLDPIGLPPYLLDRLRTPPQASPSGHGSAVAAFLEPSQRPGYIGRFAEYDVVECIGQGGMGAVFKAHDRALDRMVALKVLAPQLAASQSARQRFVREARAVAAITHEHIITIHAVGESRGLPYLVMHLVDGCSLEQRVRDGPPLDITETSRIGAQIASGLAAAHQRGIIHRDIKPSNIMLQRDGGGVRITDFGLARALNDSGVTSADQVVGTPEYMSPEQVRGRRVDHRSDLFGLGGVLYFMCTGRPPFAGDSPLATLHQVCDHEPQPVSALNPQTPSWLATLIHRLLQKEPEERPQSANEVEASLRECSSGDAPSVIASSKARPSARRSSRRFVIGSLAIVLIAAAAITFEVRRRSAAPPKDGSIVLIGASGEAPCSTLEEAIKQAMPGDIIELRWNGQLNTSPLKIDKPLRLRAGKGFIPGLALHDSPYNLILTAHPLTLEGLELSASGARSEAFPHVVRLDGGALMATNCRIIAGGGRKAIHARDPRTLRVERCEFRGGIEFTTSRPSPAPIHPTTPRVLLRHCAIEADFAIRARSGISVEWIGDRMTLQNCTFLGGTAVFIHPLRSMDVNAEHCIFGAKRSIEFDARADQGPLRLHFRWFCRQNLFSGVLLVANGKVGFEIPKTIEQWDFVWGSRVSQSLLADFTFASTSGPARFTLTSARTKDGRDIPTDTLRQTGARLDLLGPEAYAKWTNEPDYRQWQDDAHHLLAGAPPPLR